MEGSIEWKHVLRNLLNVSFDCVAFQVKSRRQPFKLLLETWNDSDEQTPELCQVNKTLKDASMFVPGSIRKSADASPEAFMRLERIPSVMSRALTADHPRLSIGIPGVI